MAPARSLISGCPMQKSRAIPLKNLQNGTVFYDTLYAKADRVSSIKCSLGSLFTFIKDEGYQQNGFRVS